MPVGPHCTKFRLILVVNFGDETHVHIDITFFYFKHFLNDTGKETDRILVVTNVYCVTLQRAQTGCNFLFLHASNKCNKICVKNVLVGRAVTQAFGLGRAIPGSTGPNISAVNFITQTLKTYKSALLEREYFPNFK
jgi:hypothetical protein